MRQRPKPSKLKAKLPVAPKPSKNQNSKVRDLEKRLTEALEQQTATSEILRVISSSPTDLQPVLDAVAERAARLCNAADVKIHLVDGDTLRLAAQRGPIPSVDARPIIPTRHIGRAVLERQTIHVHDMRTALDQFPDAAADVLTYGPRTALATPLLRDGVAIGVIQIRRLEVKPFAEKQIALLETFADQAVIAIENVRLFNETKEALEQQTATAEVLKVISRSTFDLRPVLQTLVDNATLLCGAESGTIWRFDGTVFHLAADRGVSPELKDAWARNPFGLGRGSVSGRTALEGRTVHIPDVLADPEYTLAEAQRAGGYRTILGVPMLREGVLVGVFGLQRYQVQPFTDKQIELVTTFADQAVIAIENVRLFKELESRNRDLTTALDQRTATAEILRVISSSPTNVQPVFDAIVTSAVRLLRANTGVVLRIAGELIELAAFTTIDEAGDAVLRASFPRPVRSEGASAQAIRDRAPVNIADAHTDPRFPEAEHARARTRGYRSRVVVPMLGRDQAIGAIGVTRREPGGFSDDEIALLQTFADQAVIAIENVRLFKELEAANRELAAASHHKSEFLANMSHELRTPLNAIIGFSEVLTDRMFGELNEKQDEYLKDIYASGTHLLSLINDILDLSKIEAGRMELELTDFHLPTALDNALTLVRERAGRRSISLQMSVDDRLGEVRADERKIRQVVLNLLSNAIKFTPEGGRIEVAALPKDGFVEVSVSDTGVGIAPDDHEAVFEEFRQVGTAEKKAEGTGLGLTLCRKFIELHGGRIWVKSQIAVGSTFTFTIPARRDE
jgi:signal transduction histidine kinase